MYELIAIILEHEYWHISSFCQKHLMTLCCILLLFCCAIYRKYPSTHKLFIAIMLAFIYMQKVSETQVQYRVNTNYLCNLNIKLGLFRSELHILLLNHL
jgi:hypothetical protein